MHKKIHIIHRSLQIIQYLTRKITIQLLIINNYQLFQIQIILKALLIFLDNSVHKHKHSKQIKVLKIKFQQIIIILQNFLFFFSKKVSENLSNYSIYEYTKTKKKVCDLVSEL